jgi:tRNA nucleotidyltransferase (CCA-adding enzyme)
MVETRWEHYSHPADMGIRGFGPSKAEAFAQAALALTAVITDLQTVQPKRRVEITCEDQDDEFLFVAWLNAIIYQMATRQMLFTKFEVSIENQQLRAKAWGEKIDVKKHSPAVEVKAATFTDLKVKQKSDGTWIAQCVVDV